MDNEQNENQPSQLALVAKSALAISNSYGDALGRENGSLVGLRANPFLLAAFDMVKDIVEPSFQRRMARGTMARSSHEIALSAVKPGAVMLVGLALVLEHSGIYLGDGFVAELHGSGSVCRVDLERFRLGADEDNVKLRMGDRVYVACKLSEDGSFVPLCNDEVAAIAGGYVGQNLTYNLFVNNCHLFSAACILRQRTFAPSDGLSTIEDLEDVIVRFHGIERYLLQWVPVRIAPDRADAVARIRTAKLDILDRG